MKEIPADRMAELYHNYGKTPETEISEVVKNSRIVPVFPYHDAKNKRFGWHEVDELTMKRIVEDPRENIFFFHPGKYRDDLKDYKVIIVLIESAFGQTAFNVGEIFDQLNAEDKEAIKAFYFDFDSVVRIDEEYSLAQVALYK